MGLQRRPQVVPPGRLPRLTDRYELGNLEVSPFCMGLTSEPETVEAAFDHGINFFFLTTDFHWPLYRGLRQGLKRLLMRAPSVREQMVIAAVSYVTQPGFQAGACRDLLEDVPELQYLDVAILGGASGIDFYARLMDHERTADFFPAKDLRIGCSFHERRAVIPAVRRELVDIAYFRYNTDHRGAQSDLLPHLDEGSRVLRYCFTSARSFVSHDELDRLGVPADKWRPAHADHYRYVLSDARIDGLLMAPSRPAEIVALAEAMERGPLDEAEVAYMENLSDLAAGRVEIE